MFKTNNTKFFTKKTLSQVFLLILLAVLLIIIASGLYLFDLDFLFSMSKRKNEILSLTGDDWRSTAGKLALSHGLFSNFIIFFHGSIIFYLIKEGQLRQSRGLAFTAYLLLLAGFLLALSGATALTTAPKYVALVDIEKILKGTIVNYFYPLPDLHGEGSYALEAMYVQSRKSHMFLGGLYTLLSLRLYLYIAAMYCPESLGDIAISTRILATTALLTLIFIVFEDGLVAYVNLVVQDDMQGILNKFATCGSTLRLYLTAYKVSVPLGNLFTVLPFILLTISLVGPSFSSLSTLNPQVISIGNFFFLLSFYIVLSYMNGPVYVLTGMSAMFIVFWSVFLAVYGNSRSLETSSKKLC